MGSVVRPRWIVVGLIVAAFGAAVTIGVAAAGDTDDSEVRAAQVGRLTEMERTGEMQSVLEQHRAMLERMQEDASPSMLQRMNDDPMWQMLRSDDWARLDEEHRADIDRMLGKGQP